MNKSETDEKHSMQIFNKLIYIFMLARISDLDNHTIHIKYSAAGITLHTCTIERKNAL